MPPLVAPSLLAANFGNLDAEIDIINRSQADMIHLDIMDGVFVPNISFGFPVMEAVRKKVTIPIDVHLMIVNPENYITRFAEAGASYLTLHLEAVNHLHSAIVQIHALGIKAGVSLNPHTPVWMLEEILPILDLVMIMSVNPGFGGQSFIQSSYDKIKRLKELIVQTGSNALIEVDGGVDLKNARHLINAGVDILVAGSTIFKSDDPIETIRLLKKTNKPVA